jgi:hypothetical protein
MTSPSTAGGTCSLCGEPLEGRRVGEAQMNACGRCEVLVIKQSALMPALEALSADLLPTFDADATLPALPNRSGKTPCPRCAASMESADYCGAKLVFFDRCNRCALLCIGSEELGAMSLMWARMEKRIARTRAQNAENLSGMDALTHAAHLRRAVNNSLRPIGLVLPLI